MKIKRKVLVFFMFFLLIFNNLSFAETPNVDSGAAILVETSTSKILYEKNAYEKMYPASTTKVLTAILVLENCQLDEMATVSHNAVYSLPNGYVNASLIEGEEMSVKDLMYALMVKSANDAAIVLAEHVGGSVQGFADMMNEKAKELGCKNTHFVNPNGIHDDNHYTTAYDLYLMANYGMKNPIFRKYVSTVSYTLPATNKYSGNDRICLTTNDLLKRNSKYYNENAIGIKTGHTTEAKNCLIAGAEKNDVELISVVLHSGTNKEGLSVRYVDTNKLFDYGFNEFKFTDFVITNDVIQNIEIENGTKETKNLDLLASDTLNAYINTDTNLENLEPNVTLNENIQAPIKQNDILGTATYTIDGIEYTTELIASHNVDKKIDIEIFILVGAIILLLIGIFILLKPRKKHKRKK